MWAKIIRSTKYIQQDQQEKVDKRVLTYSAAEEVSESSWAFHSANFNNDGTSSIPKMTQNLLSNDLPPWGSTEHLAQNEGSNTIKNGRIPHICPALRAMKLFTGRMISTSSLQGNTILDLKNFSDSWSVRQSTQWICPFRDPCSHTYGTKNSAWTASIWRKWSL
jgi:hypothetical protein